MANTILHYYQPTSQSDSLPVPHSPLARVIPSAAIESANREVQAVLDEAKSRKRGPYRKFSPKKRAEIGKFAVENGVLAAARKYSKVFGKPINESTVRQFKQAYLKERSRKRRTEHSEDDLVVDELPLKKKEEDHY